MQEQDGNQARQMVRLKQVAGARDYDVVAQLAEQAPSLNEKRKGMRRPITLIKE